MYVYMHMEWFDRIYNNGNFLNIAVANFITLYVLFKEHKEKLQCYCIVETNPIMRGARRQ